MGLLREKQFLETYHVVWQSPDVSTSDPFFSAKVVVLLLYVHGKQLWSCQDSQLA